MAQQAGTSSFADPSYQRPMTARADIRSHHPATAAPQRQSSDKKKKNVEEEKKKKMDGEKFIMFCPEVQRQVQRRMLSSACAVLLTLVGMCTCILADRLGDYS